MKKTFITSLLLISFLITLIPALATNDKSLNANSDAKLKSKLLQLRRKQVITKTKIKRNLSQAKTRVNTVKRKRAAVKAKRAIIKKRAARKNR